jgi:hypothetical protein
MKTPAKWRARWRIVAMELWDQDYVDMEVEGHLTIDGESLGAFQFGLVQGALDCRFTERDGRPLVEFSWLGADENDDASGRGWASMTPAGDLEGRMFIHCGDDSAFRAEKGSAPPATPRAKRQR